ncbi:MAG: MBL fold metallo-hydrolase [Bryobacteraceae bacterium]|nr:MBL fold metallo-hydrolase [Bryobacteraceae bacterium]MDW8378998.1 MBL fold metallo-hydrolase [Bryobacterales bacterium]
MANEIGEVRLTVLGSGTSAGVPTIGCHCPVCTSPDPRDSRLRPSVLVQFQGYSVIVDTSPDFRAQILRERVERIDAVLFTHAHADHIMGLDDVRPFNFRQRGQIPVYGSEETLAVIQRVFAYIFSDEPSESWVPQLKVHAFAPDETLDLFGYQVTPIRLKHGKGTVYGFRFGPLAYLTDHSEIPEESLEKLKGVDVVFLDALRHKPHPTHSTVAQSLAYANRIAARLTYFTHISHDLPHEATESELPSHVRLAYDGLQVTARGNV